MPAESSAQLSPAAQPGTPDNLAFSDNLLQNKPVVEDLWKTQQQTSQDTEHLLSRAQRELTVEEVPATPAAKQPAATQAQTSAAAPANPSATAPVGSIPRGSGSAVTQPAPRNPAPAATKGQPAATAAARDSELYTVQVFSSKSRESAVGLVDRLKGMGFAAYLNQFQDSGRNTWYRVRVGKTNKTEAERLKSSLQERANLKSPQVLPL